MKKKNKKIESNNIEVGTSKESLQVQKVDKTKQEKLRQVIAEINRTRGENSIKFASEEAPAERIPTGIKEIDNLIGGGIICSGFTTLWGRQANGKTTLVYRIIAQAQKVGKTVLLINLERSYDKTWAEKNGVDNSKLLIAPDYITAEEVMDDIIKFCKEKVIDMIVVDSIQGLSPQGEQLDKKGKTVSIEHDEMALLARKLSKFFRVVSADVYKSKVAVLLVGQTRVGLGGYIALDELSGGFALKHWSSLILHIKRGAKADAPTKKIVVDGKKKDKIIGFLSIIKLEKRKVSSEPEGSETSLPFYYEKGF